MPVKIEIFREAVWRNGETIYLLGRRQNGEELLTQVPVQNLEEYLLQFETRPWQRFFAKYLRKAVFLGKFQPLAQGANYLKYYLFWSKACGRFAVSYPHGFNKRRDCNFCNSNRDMTPDQLKEHSRKSALLPDTAVFYPARLKR